MERLDLQDWTPIGTVNLIERVASRSPLTLALSPGRGYLAFRMVPIISTL
jgi:hypothetical protein